VEPGRRTQFSNARMTRELLGKGRLSWDDWPHGAQVIQRRRGADWTSRLPQTGMSRKVLPHRSGRRCPPRTPATGRHGVDERLRQPWFPAKAIERDADRKRFEPTPIWIRVRRQCLREARAMVLSAPTRRAQPDLIAFQVLPLPIRSNPPGHIPWLARLWRSPTVARRDVGGSGASVSVGAKHPRTEVSITATECGGERRPSRPSPNFSSGTPRSGCLDGRARCRTLAAGSHQDARRRT
jgi:hypothetical protein